MGRNVQFYCERFGTSLHDAVTLVKERKLLADEEMIWRAYMIKELVTELSMGWVDLRVGLGWVGSGSRIFNFSGLGWVMGLKWQICEKQMSCT